MGKTKEQILAEKEKEQNIKEMPTRLILDKLNAIQVILACAKPVECGFGDEQKWETVWSEDEAEVIRLKALQLIRDL